MAGNAWWSSGHWEDVLGCCLFPKSMKHRKRMAMHSWLSPNSLLCVCVVQAVRACCWGEGAHIHVWRSTGKRLRSRVFLFISPPSFLKQNNSVSLDLVGCLYCLAYEPWNPPVSVFYHGNHNNGIPIYAHAVDSNSGPLAVLLNKLAYILNVWKKNTDSQPESQC